MLLYHANHISLLFGRNSTADNSLASLAYSDEVLPVPVVVTYVSKRFVLHNNRSPFLKFHKLFISHDAF